MVAGAAVHNQKVALHTEQAKHTTSAKKTRQPHPPVAAALRTGAAAGAEAGAARPQEVVGGRAVHGPDRAVHAVVERRPPAGPRAAAVSSAAAGAE